MRRKLVLICLLTTMLIAMVVPGQACGQQDTIRVLCIGNSFSWDAVEQELYPLAKAQGVELIIGNLYYGGCSLQQHYEFYRDGKKNYSFRIIRDGNRTVKEHCSLNDALAYGTWDYISFQQASHDSGKRLSYEPYLRSLTQIVRKEQPQARFCWLQTWSYSQDAKHPAFPYYGSSQQTMNDSIAVCTGMVMKSYPKMLLVPCGSAITYARQTMGDVLCRDGYHLNYEYGRYVASCVWCELLTGKSVLGNTYNNGKMTEEQVLQAQQAAHQAVKRPFLQKK